MRLLAFRKRLKYEKERKVKKLNNTQKALKRMIRDTESKITDEELFLSSAFQKYQTSLAKAATGRSRYGLQVLMEWDSSENADMLYDAADIPLPRTRRQNLHLYEKSLFPNSRSPPLYPII